jgi:hypothetical protein
MRSSGRAYDDVPSSLILKYPGTSFCNALNTALALSISPMPTKQIREVYVRLYHSVHVVKRTRPLLAELRLAIDSHRREGPPSLTVHDNRAR